MNPLLPIAAITDEFSPKLNEALPAMLEIGMTGAELRVIDGQNILDLNDEQLKQAKDALDVAGLRVISIASPLLKCILKDGPELDTRFEHDVFAAKHTLADQPRLTKRAIEVAHFFGARIVRVFSYWRTARPKDCREAIARALQELAKLGQQENLIFGLENEHACNIGTATETAELLKLVPEPAIGIVWDPANALVAGETPFPEGYARLSANRIVHVHAKDCEMRGGQPEWGPLGTRHVPWKEQIAQLRQDGYNGYLSLETHWPGPNGNKLEASRICGWNLRGLAAG